MNIIKHIIVALALAGGLAAQTVTLSDTLTNAVGGGSFTGRITVTLNAPASAQPLYYSTTSLTGWQAVYCVGVTGADCTSTTSAGVFAATLYANSTITPAGTSYAARFQPAKGSPWSETWTVEASDTKLYQVRSTTVPSPTVTFQPSQLALAAGSLLYGSSAGVGTALAPGTNGHILTLSGGYPSWAASTGGTWGSITGTLSAQTDLQSALNAKQASDADLTAISALTGSGLLARTGSGTYAVRTITGTANQITVSHGNGASQDPVISLPSTITGLTSVTSAGFTGALTGNAATATALAANPADCPSGEYATTIAANGDLTCAAVAYAQVSGTPSLAAIATSGSASDLTTGTVAAARLGTGTANSTTFLRGDGSWATPAGGGSGTVTSVSTSTSLFSIANATTTPSIDVTGTSGGIPYFATDTTLASSAALDAGALVVGGGAGAAPSILANSSVPNAGELRISTAPAASATRAVLGLGSAIASGSANGTVFGINYTSFVGDFVNWQTGGTNRFRVSSAGTITIGAVNTYGIAGSSLSNTATVEHVNANTGAAAALRVTGSAGTGTGNFVALRSTSAGGGANQLRINADERGVMIGQTAESSSVANLSLGVFDDTASTGVTRIIVQNGANQGSVSPVELRDYNATLGSGTVLFEVEPDGSFRSLPTGTKPTCASGIRGTYWYTQGGSGVKDASEQCLKDAADAYAWRTIY